ncbi:hydantoinase B/oxoprolinase family protein, partial [Bacillus sp. WP8]|uniref:hydantoinase B/oxoprolinase family protein n=1 Tax=Bacillus sp. WP8 TaxID=756828 RepID=UPI0011A08971
SLKKAIEETEHIHPPHIIITNHPYTTHAFPTHLPHLHIINPIFLHAEILSYASSFVHVTDLPGLLPSTISPTPTHLHQQALTIPPLKIYQPAKHNH